MIGDRVTAPVSPTACLALFLSHPYFEVAVAAGGCSDVASGVIRKTCDCASPAPIMQLRMDSWASLRFFFFMPDKEKYHKVLQAVCNVQRIEALQQNLLKTL